MPRFATILLGAVIVLTGVVALIGFLHAGSVPFAIHMALIVLWAAVFLAWVVWRARRDAVVKE
jgi:hypothetical protein